MKILIVDDEPLARTRMQRLLEDIPEAEVAGEAKSGKEALLRSSVLNPDVVLLDVAMPGEGGLSALRRILRRDPEARIVMLTMHADDAAGQGFSEGDMVKLHLDRGILELPLRLSSTMARGVAVLPRHRQLQWQQLDKFHERLPICRIEKA